MPRRIGDCVCFPASSRSHHWKKSFMCESMNLDCRCFSATESYESTRYTCLLLTGTEEIIYQLNITVVINIRATNFYHRFSFFLIFDLDEFKWRINGVKVFHTNFFDRISGPKETRTNQIEPEQYFDWSYFAAGPLASSRSTQLFFAIENCDFVLIFS